MVICAAMDGPQPSIQNLIGSGSTSSAVPVEHMDYSYIRECQNVKELEKILRALRSGEHGFYPDLIDFCEKSIETLAPQSKVLRKDKPPASMYDVGKEEWQQLNADIKDWATEMGEASAPSPGVSNSDDTLPPIRKPATFNTQGEKKKNEDKEWGKPSAERIKSSDFLSWDKFNADAAAEAVDKNGDEKPKQPKASPVTLGSTIDTEGMTNKERVTVANKEKNKGNEAFKAGDFDEAVQYYTRSISVIPSAPSYNNRSLARIKLGQFMGALEDCTKVLELEPENIKALLRRGTARKALRVFVGAREDLQAVLKAEPNNKQAMDLLADILAREEIDRNSPMPTLKPIGDPEPKGRRIVIEEVECDSDEEEEDGKGQGSLLNGSGPPDTGEGGDGNGKEKATPVQDGRGSVTTATAPEPGNGEATPGEGTGSPVSVATPPASNDGGVAGAQSGGGSVAMAMPPPALPLPDDIVALKDCGNQLFKAGQYSEAMEKYSSAIAKLFPDKDSFSAALGTLYSNRAACNFRTGHLRATISDCDMALGIQPYSVKTLVRRGTAYEALENYHCAYVDYQTGLKLDTTNQSAQSGTTRMMRILLDQDGPRWREYLPPSPGMFGLPLPPPTLTTMAPSKASPPSATATTKSASNPTLATSVQTSPPLPEPKGQEVNHQEVKGQEIQSQDVGGQDAKGKPSVTSEETRRPNAKLNPGSEGGGVKVKDGSGVKVSGDPTPTIDPNLSAETNFQKLKADGNSLVQQGDYAKATLFYSACIAVDASQAVSYTNRALCFIKLLKWSKAEADCTKALELNETNVKALYRRALARKMLHKFSDSARDLTSLLKIEPTNASAKKELDQVKEMWRQELKNNQQKTTEKSNQAKPTEVKPTEVKSPEVKPSEVKPSEVKSSEVKPAEVKPSEVKPSEVKPSEVKPSEVKSDVTSKKKKKGKRMQIQEIEAISEDDVEVGKPSPKTAEKMTPKDKKGGKSGRDTGSHKGGKNPGGQDNKTPRDTGSQKGGKSPGGQDNKTPRDTGSQKGGKNRGERDDKVTVPKLNKITAYEFLQAWTSLKRHKSMQAYADLLKQILPEELPEVLTNKLDGDMLVSIIKAVCEHLVESDADLSFGLLSNLPKVERFKTVGLFLSAGDKKRLRNSLKKLGNRKTEAYTESDIENLRQQYSL